MTARWLDSFDERQRKEIDLDIAYATQEETDSITGVTHLRWGHGTDGHNSRLIIAKMAGMLGYLENENEMLRQALEKE